MTRQQRLLRAFRGFTLIELLVVIALTGLLLALILGPLVQAFQLTNRARALTEAQDASRFGINQLQRELSQATYVFDNSNTPMVFPLSGNASDTRAQNNPNVYPVQNGVPNPTPSILYAKIDFIPAATQGEGPQAVVDPTTGKPLGGRPLVLPLAPGRRIVRYFVGLRNNYTRNADGSYAGPAYYSNPFEFRGTDNAQNPFVLWRVEFDPDNENLVDPNVSPVAPNGINDPNFFYNSNVAPNGRRYAENWRAIASPVLATTNLDLLAWRRGRDRQLVAGNPFQVLFNVTPSAVSAETATPGFVNNVGGDASDAVPNLYSTQYGAWTLPYTLTFYRATTRYTGVGNNGGRFGQMRFVVDNQLLPGLLTRVRLRMISDTGSLDINGNANTTADDSYYYMEDSETGKLFVFTERLAFQIDPARGQVETAFPPVANSGGVPLHYPGGNMLNPPVPLSPGPLGNSGKLAVTVLRRDTLDRRAGGVNPNNIPYPQNQGIVVASFADDQYVSGSQGLRYYLARNPVGLLSNAGTAYPSPFAAFMPRNSTRFRGIKMVSGSERVYGPDATISTDPSTGGAMLTNYYRLPINLTGNGSALSKQAKRQGASAVPSAQDRWFWSGGEMTYQIDNQLGFYDAPLLVFDTGVEYRDSLGNFTPPDQIAPATGAAGIPARSLGDTGPRGELLVSYLWQNNFARRADGKPVNAWGEFTGSIGVKAGNQGIGTAEGHVFVTAADYRPEADVLRVDYATRSVVQVLLGARVFDSSSGVPQTAQVANKVTVGNATR